jgi:cytochrome c-type biogenesis protein
VPKGQGFEARLGGHTLYLHPTSLLSGLLLIGLGYLLVSGQLALITRLAAGSDLSLGLVELQEGMQALFNLR